MKPPQLAAEQIREIGSPCYEVVARAEWTDRKQHVNMRYFVGIFDDAADAFYLRIVGVSLKRFHYLMFLVNESSE